MTTTTKVDREYMYEVSFYLSVFFFLYNKNKSVIHNNGYAVQETMIERKEKREGENQCEWTKRQQKNCSIKRECLNKRRGKFLTNMPHTAKMLFSQKIVQKKVYIYTQKEKNDFYQEISFSRNRTVARAQKLHRI